MCLSDEVLEKYIDIIEVVEITEYDDEALAIISDFLEGASRLAPGAWTWTEEGERLLNVPSPYFWQLWRAAKEKLRALGFHPRPEMKDDQKEWVLYFHVEEFLNHSLEAVQEIDWAYDAFTRTSEVDEASTIGDFPLTDAEQTTILEILEDYDFLVVSEWRWRASTQSLWNYPSEYCLEIWQTAPEMLRQSGFQVFSKCEGDEKTCILYFNITDKFRKYVLSVTAEPF